MKKDQEQKALSIKLLDLFEDLMMRGNHSKAKIVKQVIEHYRIAEQKNTQKSFPFRQFYPFLWIAVFAQLECPVNRTSRNPLSFMFTGDLEVLEKKEAVGEYCLTENRIILITKKRDDKQIAATGAHEIAHAVFNYVTNSGRPSAEWSSYLAARASVSSLLSFDYGVFSSLHQYSLVEFTEELLVRTVEYTLLQGEISSSYRYGRQREAEALRVFLKDCEKYFHKLIADSKMAKIFPWLLKLNPGENVFSCPEPDFFLRFVQGDPLWNIVLECQNMDYFQRVFTVDPEFKHFPFPQFIDLVEDNAFKTQVLTWVSTQGITAFKQLLAKFEYDLSPLEDEPEVASSSSSTDPRSSIMFNYRSAQQLGDINQQSSFSPS